MLGSVALEILSLVTAEGSTAKQLSDVVHRDPALAAQVMRIANSAMFSPLEPVRSLNEAVTRLGFGTLRDVAVASSVRSKVFSFGEFADVARDLWRHSLATAAIARELGRRQTGDGGTAFLCGLLHDLGKAVALRVVAKFIEDPVGRRGNDEIWRIADDSHGEVGAHVAHAWKLPPEVVDAIENHHHWRESRGDQSLCAITTLANDYAHQMWPIPEAEHEPLDGKEEHVIMRAVGIPLSAVSRVFDLRAVVEALVVAIG